MILNDRRALALSASALFIVENTPVAAQAQGRRGGTAAQPQGVFKTRVTPHWFANNTRFWYRNDLRGGAREFIVVDVDPAKRAPAFDHDKLAAAIATATETQVNGSRLPFDAIEFVDDGKAIRFTVGSANWKCDLATYSLSKSEGSPVREPAARAPYYEPWEQEFQLAMLNDPHAASHGDSDAMEYYMPPQAGGRGGDTGGE